MPFLILHLDEHIRKLEILIHCQQTNIRGCGQGQVYSNALETVFIIPTRNYLISYILLFLSIICRWESSGCYSLVVKRKTRGNAWRTTFAHRSPWRAGRSVPPLSSPPVPVLTLKCFSKIILQLGSLDTVFLKLKSGTLWNSVKRSTSISTEKALTVYLLCRRICRLVACQET